MIWAKIWSCKVHSLYYFYMHWTFESLPHHCKQSVPFAAAVGLHLTEDKLCAKVWALQNKDDDDDSYRDYKYILWLFNPWGKHLTTMGFLLATDLRSKKIYCIHNIYNMSQQFQLSLGGNCSRKDLEDEENVSIKRLIWTER